MAAPLCPRCEYDLTGLVATWAVSCPMHAMCSECGLRFDCGNVLSARSRGPEWSFEHGVQASGRRWGRTSSIALNPWALTSALRIDHAVQVRRAIVLGLSWALLLHAALLITRLADGPMDLNVAIFPYAAPLNLSVGWGRTIDFAVFPFVLAGIVPTLLTPAWMLLLGTTFEAAKLRRAHLVRGWAYAMPGAVLWVFLMVGSFWLSELALAGRRIGPAAANAVQIGAAIVLPVYRFAWWWLFIRRYLMLRHAMLTTILMEILSWLSLLLLALFLSARRFP